MPEKKNEYEINSQHQQNFHLMKRLPDAMEHRVLDAAATSFVKLKRRIQKQFVRELLVRHAPGKCSIRSSTRLVRLVTRDDSLAVIVVKLLQLLSACDLLQFVAQPFDLSSELNLELGILRLVVRQMVVGLIQRDEGVLDAAGELGLVRNLPRLESLEELKQKRREIFRELTRDGHEAPASVDEFANLLKEGDERCSSPQKRDLQCAHGFEDVRRSVCDHESRKEDTHIDILRGKRPARRAVSECRQEMNALKARLGDADDVLLP